MIQKMFSFSISSSITGFTYAPSSTISAEIYFESTKIGSTLDTTEIYQISVTNMNDSFAENENITLNYEALSSLSIIEDFVYSNISSKNTANNNDSNYFTSKYITALGFISCNSL